MTLASAAGPNSARDMAGRECSSLGSGARRAASSSAVGSFSTWLWRLTSSGKSVPMSCASRDDEKVGFVRYRRSDSAWLMSIAFWKRSSGSFAHALRTICASSSGISRRFLRGLGTSAFRTRSRSAGTLSSW